MIVDTLRGLVMAATEQLATISDTPRLDAEVLLAAALNFPRSYLHAWPDKRLIRNEQISLFAGWIDRRRAGEPVAYLINKREFWSLELVVTQDTFIPRPETELLVELALEKIPVGQSLSIADLGTGSGAIALALASERPLVQVTATDHSVAALMVAQRNALKFGCNNIEFYDGDWCTPLFGKHFNLIVSNPPYISAADPYLRDYALKFEPHAALFSGTDGLEAIKIIISNAPNHLYPDGWLLLEHGYDQGEIVPDLLCQYGFIEVTNYVDINGLSRSSCGLWGG
jgi:release factor glutamine methyltransferase